MSLNLQDCQNLVIRHYAAIPGKENKKRKRLEHAGRVLRLCQEIAAQLSQPLQEELLYQAALLHDIAKFDDDETHPTLALAVIKKELGPEQSAANSALLDGLDKIISVHKDGFLPSPDLAAEAAVLRMADKIDQLRRKTRKALKAQAKVKEAEESLREAEEKVKKASKAGDREKLAKKQEKLDKKEEKLDEKQQDLADASHELQKSNGHYQDSLHQISAYAQRAEHGGCTPEFTLALQSICDRLKDLPLPSAEA